MKKTISTILKVVPLLLYLRAACCKLGVPVAGCDAPLCPVAIGQEADCTPTGNTAEAKAWCEHAWVPWINELFEAAAVPAEATCTESTDFVLLKVIAGLELTGYGLLWLSPQLGGLWLTVFMGFGLHFHVVHLKEPLSALGLQLGLLFASTLVMVLESFGTSGSKQKEHQKLS